jgi:hypothetical protein
LELKYPLEYELDPERIEKGNHWITVKLRNIGNEDLRFIKVQLNSLDSSCFVVDGLPKAFDELKQNETEDVPFQVTAFKTGDIYVSLIASKGARKPESLYWESSPMSLVVGEEKAELKSLFILTHPHVSLGETLEVEAIVQGLGQSEGLRLEFWAQTPKGTSVELAKTEIKDLSAGEEERLSATLKAEETGYYTIHAYLYDNSGRIDYKSDTILVE